MGKFSAFMLPLKSLTVGTHRFSYHLDKQFFVNMESPDVRDADLTVDLTVNFDGEFYVLDFAIGGTVTLVCDRCLDELIYPLEATYQVTVKLGEDYNDDSDDVLEIPASDPTLNVSYMIYDTVTLAIPLKHVHPLGKCNRAMSAVLRKHRARGNDEDAELENDLIDEMDTMSDTADSDPRWDALKKLSGTGDSEE